MYNDLTLITYKGSEMDKKQLQQDIDSMRVKLTEMEATLNAPENKGVWKPVTDDPVHCIGIFGDVYEVPWIGHPTDLMLLAIGNVYRTQEVAELARDKRLAYVRVTNKLRELEGDWVADFENTREEKWCAEYDHEIKKFSIDYNYALQTAIADLYSTEDAWEWVIDNMVDDLKLIYGVK